MQRTAMLEMLSALRTTPTQALEVETYLLPTHLRLLQRGREVITRLQTLPDTHPATGIVEKARITKVGRKRRKRVPNRKNIENAQRGTSGKNGDYQHVPGGPVGGHAAGTRQRQYQQRHGGRGTDEGDHGPRNRDLHRCVRKNGSLGAAVVILDHDGMVYETRPIAVGPESQWTVPAAELIAIYYAIELAIHIQRTSGAPQPKRYTIFSDSWTGLQAIAHPHGRRTQVTQEIYILARRAKLEHHAHIKLRWIQATAESKEAKKWIGLPKHREPRPQPQILQTGNPDPDNDHLSQRHIRSQRTH